MKKKIMAATLAAMLVMGMTGVSVNAKSENKDKTEGTTFVYGTTGYSEEMGDAGLNPHDNYSGWSCLRYGVGAPKRARGLSSTGTWCCPL